MMRVSTGVEWNQFRNAAWLRITKGEFLGTPVWGTFPLFILPSFCCDC